MVSIIILFSACDDPVPFEFSLREYPLGEPFQIAAGETVILTPDSVQFYFDRIVFDTRCPLQSQCILDGLAHAEFLFYESGPDTPRIDLYILGYVAMPDTAEHIDTDTLGYRFTLMQLDPYPEFGSNIQPNVSAIVNVVDIDTTESDSTAVL